MDYTQALDFLFSRRQKNIKLGLNRMQDLLDRLGRPEKQFRSIHIAGTNGKGSTAAMIAAMLQAAGYKTGLYTSPHLIDMRERIQINGVIISKNRMLEILKNMRPHIESAGASFFETVTALAFLCFAESRVDIAVVETGLGGRLDATNTLMPLTALVTEIGLDHTKILGKTCLPIAAEKAGIFKPGIPCIIGSRHKSVNAFFRTQAQARGCPVHFTQESVRCHHIRLTESGTWADISVDGHRYDRLYLKLLGRHQVNNLATALLCVEKLKKDGWRMTESAVRHGLKQVRWPGRLDLIQSHPKLLLDSAHNPLGAGRLARAIKTIFTYHRLILIFGVLADKNYTAMFGRLAPLADKVILTRPPGDRALPPQKLKQSAVCKDRPCMVESDIGKAMKLALNQSGPNDMICGTGSIYFVGELLKILQKTKESPIA